MDEKRFIDGCCCEGGCSEGYRRAGFTPYGIDLFEDYTQGRYPFPSYKGDVVIALKTLLSGGSIPFTAKDGSVEWLSLKDFAFIHVSPPCQKWSITNAARKADYPELIEPLRELCIDSGLPYVIENVVGAPLKNPVELCGCMFDLKGRDSDGKKLHMWRPRQFETNWDLEQPERGSLKIKRSNLAVHSEKFHAYPWVAGCYGGSRKAKRFKGETLAHVAPRDRHEAKYVRKGGYVPRNKAVVQRLLGIDWMTWGGMHQSIPPVYTEFIGDALMRELRG